MIRAASDRDAVQEACRLLQKGDLVGLPTETVYGLGGDAFNEAAVRKIYEVKKRPATNPLIVHIASFDQVDHLITQVPDSARILMEKFWPGPLTFVLPKHADVLDLVTAGKSTVAVRMPSHSVMREVLTKSGLFIAAPSANKFQGVSPTSAAAVESELGGSVSLILDGGTCSVGIESTVVGFEGNTPVLYRAGGVTREELESVVGPVKLFSKQTDQTISDNEIRNQTPNTEDAGQSLSSPGLLDFHYAPKTPLLFTGLEEFRNEALKSPEIWKHRRNIGLLVFDDQQVKVIRENRRTLFAGHAELRWTGVLSASGDFEEAARNLYRLLREADSLDLDGLVVFKCPNTGLGVAINDRMSRAHHW